MPDLRQNKPGDFSQRGPRLGPGSTSPGILSQRGPRLGPGSAGFRWSEGSGGEGRGLWHPELCTEVNVLLRENLLRHPERSNLLTIILDTVDDGRASCEKPRLHVVGIEDSVLQWCGIACYIGNSAGPSATLRAITSLAMAGIGGPSVLGISVVDLHSRHKVSLSLTRLRQMQAGLRSRSASREAERDGELLSVGGAISRAG